MVGEETKPGLSTLCLLLQPQARLAPFARRETASIVLKAGLPHLEAPEDTMNVDFSLELTSSLSGKQVRGG